MKTCGEVARYDAFAKATLMDSADVLPLTYRFMLPGVFFKVVMNDVAMRREWDGLFSVLANALPSDNIRCRQIFTEYVILVKGIYRFHEIAHPADAASRSVYSGDEHLCMDGLRKRLRVESKLFQTIAMHTAVGCRDKKMVTNIRRMRRWYNEVVFNGDRRGVFYINVSGPVSLTIMLTMLRLHEQICLLNAPIWDMSPRSGTLIQTIVDNKPMLDKNATIHLYESVDVVRRRQPKKTAVYIAAAYDPSIDTSSDTNVYCVLELRFDKKPKDLPDYYAAVLNVLWERTGDKYLDADFLSHHLMFDGVCHVDAHPSIVTDERHPLYTAAILATYDKVHDESTHDWCMGDVHTPITATDDGFTPLPDEDIQPCDAYQSCWVSNVNTTVTNLLHMISTECAINNDAFDG